MTDALIFKEKRARDAIKFTIWRFNRYPPFIDITIDMFTITTDIDSKDVKCFISEEHISALNQYVKEAFLDNLNELFRAFGFRTVRQARESDETGKQILVFILGGFRMDTTTK